MVYLAASLAAGVLQVTSAALVPVVRTTYIHFLVLGWLTQLIFGVAFWMFPRPSREASRGTPQLGWMCYWLLNLGLLLRAVGEPAQASGHPLDWVLGAAALLQLVAGWIFIVLIWPRVKER